jgi:adenine-specific DNA-methyltransferase
LRTFRGGATGDDARLLEHALVDENGPLRDKATGLELTHPSITNLIALMALSDGFSPRRVLDPATGFGNFLYEVGCLSDSVTELVGYETDQRAAEVARGRLWEMATRGVRVDVRHEDALLAPIEAGSFDLVISNPPYIRVQRMGEATATLREKYETASGRFDMYFLFIELATRALASGGRLAMITSNKFMTTNAGRSLRDLLTREFTPLRIVDFRDASPFKAAVLPVVLILERTRSSTNRGRWVELERMGVARETQAPGVEALAADPVPATVVVPHLGGQAMLASVESYPISDWRRGGQPWHHTSGDEDDVESLVMDGFPTFGKMFAKFSVGIKTTADDVFITPFDEGTASSGLVERALLHPLIRGQTIRRWRVSWDADNGYDRYVLYPHRASAQGRTQPVELDAYPLAKAFLEQHRARLEARPYVIAAGRRWYEIWVTQRVATLMAPKKLVFPDFATRNSFALDYTGAFVGSSAAFGVPRDGVDDDDLWYALYLANSPLYDYLHRRHVGTSILAKRLRFWTGHVAKYPLPWPKRTLRIELAASAKRAAEAGEEPQDYLERSVASFGLAADDELRVARTVVRRMGRL